MSALEKLEKANADFEEAKKTNRFCKTSRSSQKMWAAKIRLEQAAREFCEIQKGKIVAFDPLG